MTRGTGTAGRSRPTTALGKCSVFGAPVNRLCVLFRIASPSTFKGMEPSPFKGRGVTVTVFAGRRIEPVLGLGRDGRDLSRSMKVDFIDDGLELVVLFVGE